MPISQSGAVVVEISRRWLAVPLNRRREIATDAQVAVGHIQGVGRPPLGTKYFEYLAGRQARPDRRFSRRHLNHVRQPLPIRAAWSALKRLARGFVVGDDGPCSI